MALTLVAGRRTGKTALQWHLLKQESTRVGRPIECCHCRKPHDKPGPYGQCAGCGHSYYGIASDAQLPLQLEATSLDFHGGEQ